MEIRSPDGRYPDVLEMTARSRLPSDCGLPIAGAVLERSDGPSVPVDHPSFGSLLFRLKDGRTERFATMATDGVSLYYNPEFVDTRQPSPECWPTK